MREAIKI
jgi:hypothetical protein